MKKYDAINQVLNVLKNDKDFQINCYREEKNESYNVSFVYRNGIDLTSFSLKFEINHKLLWSEYQKLEGNKSFETNITEEERFIEFIKTGYNEIIKHLKSFNSSKDDYQNIAKLFENYRGGIGLHKYGI